MKKGFSLIELLIYVSIFAVAGGMMFSILALMLKVNQRESSTGEITSQLNFVSQTLSRLIRSSSNIEIDAGIATSTLKLRMKDSTKDPTCIYLDDINGIIKLAEGPDTPFNLQNCTPNASDLTNDKIKVDKLEFIKSTQYPGHDSVSMNIQMSYNSPNPGAQASRELKSASMRFSTAEFSDNIFPTADAIYDIGTSTNRWRNAAFSGNLSVAGNVGVGTTTPSEKLTVVDGNILNINNNPVRVEGVQLNSGENNGYSIAVSGRYTYVATNTSPARVVVVDISNPSNPVRVGGVQLNSGEDYSRSIAVSGRYAYVVTNTSPARVVVVDISNPSNPVRVGGVQLNSGENSSRSIAVSGRYAYVTTYTSPARVAVVDISNPSNPVRVGGVQLNSGEDYSYIIAVSGRYAYVAMATTPGRLAVVDISNPSNPVWVGGVQLNSGEDYSSSIAVSGRYAYVVTWTDPARVVVVDISNPSNPVRVGGVQLNSGEKDGYPIVVSGRYAYVVTWTDPARVVVVDISNPSNPVRVGGVQLNSGEGSGRSIAVSGRYAYVVTNASPARVVAVDVKGIESVSANIHSLEAGNLQVRNDIIAQGQLQVSGGINVGTGGIFSAGPIGISIASTTQTDAISAYFQGRVGISTTTPTQKLEVNGGIRLNAISESQPTCNDATNIGTLWHKKDDINGDQLQICAASSTNYAWRPL